MDFLPTLLLALAMSADAFAAAVGKGAALHKPRFAEALRTGLIFGVIEGLTPVMGWAMGRVAAPYVVAWDHWIAFVLLVGLGSIMIWNACKSGVVEILPQKHRLNPTEVNDGGVLADGGHAAATHAIQKRTRHSFWLLAITGFATSIDAMAVGVTLAFLDVSIVGTAIAIGFTTLVMVTLGVMLGRVLGTMAGNRAEIVGGLILIGIGVFILYEHAGGALTSLITQL